tara:strand:+ start:63 stop:623 length:561 start_codon:yes stop_codon:yes gene_type:complete
MANSKRKCPYCEKHQKADTMLIVGIQAFCNKDHYIEHQVANKSKLVEKGRKIKRKEHAKAKERVKTRAEWLRDAQKWFNKYVRLRDRYEPCISCQRYHTGQYHAGHYLSVGANPELRFNELNNNKQCSACNNHLSGNIVNYRPNLINKIGIESVEWLEGPHKPAKYTIEQLKEIIAKYKAKCKEIE